MYKSRLHYCLTSTAMAVVLLCAQPAWAVDALIDTGELIPGSDTSDYGLSADGKVAVGFAYVNATDYHAFRWESGVMSDLGTLGGAKSTAYATSADGSIVAGYAQNAGAQWRAFRWESGVMTDLGTLGGNNSYGYAISGDGNIIVGQAQNGAGRNRAFRWESGVMSDLGTLGGNNSYARGISGDGTVIVGAAQNAGGQYHAFGWESGVMSDLGTLGGGNDSYAVAASRDGSVITGDSNNASGDYHTFRWENGVMTDLGTLGGAESYSWAITPDGKKIGGESITATGDYHGFLWENGVMRDVNDMIPDFAGLDYLAWVSGFSDDGNIIMGGGYNDAGNYHVYIVNLAVLAATTPEQIAQDLAPAIAPSDQGHFALSAQVGNSLQVARNAALYFPSAPTRSATPAPTVFAANTAANPADIEPAAGGDDSNIIYSLPDERRHAVYAIGNYGWGQGDNDIDSTSANLNTGVLVKMTDNFTFGAGIIGARSTNATAFDGKSRINATGVTMLGAYAPPSGVTFYTSAAFSTLDADIDRRYFNGVSVDASHGETEGTAFGGVARLGYQHNISATSNLMPYGEAEVTHVSLDAYSETGGAFPATVGEQSTTTTISRLGAELSQQISPDFTVRTRAAWGHRYGDPDTISATAATITVNVPASSGDKNWAEAGMSGTWQLDGGTLLSADLAGRSGETAAPAVNLTAGITVPF